ncbi:MAG: SRPBCC family protein [Polyangiaceae bacterium]
MKEFHTAIKIQSTPAKIWSILTDGAAYTSWNTSVVEVTGEIALGKKVAIRPKINPKQAFPVKVVEMEPEKKMVWRGGMPIGTLFKGERTYTLTPQTDGTVEFSMREEFTGLMAPLITKSIPDMQPAFEEFAACLKKKAEVS